MKTSRYFLLLTSIFFISHSVHGAKIAKVSGKKVYLLLDSPAEASKGSIFEIMDPQGKKKGLVKVMKIKGKRALGQLKGTANKGWSLKLRKAQQVAKSQDKAEEPEEKNDRYENLKQSSPGTFYGVMAGFATNNMTATIDQTGNSTAEVNMTGSGFSGRLLFDHALWTSVWFRGLLGLENFATEGAEDVCGASNDTACDVEISYLSLDLWGRYLFSQGNFRPWVGLGFNLLFPSSKASTAIDEKSITSTSVFAGGGGLDWFFKPDMYIPLQVEYGLYPSSETVKAHYIAFRFGIGIYF
ncbi:MAG: hypothetical protein H6625_11060 [Bdellovibrionaceae bacterium]|nr:hypothetical protein [Pseudobdellovibrionaceae bacterium]